MKDKNVNITVTYITAPKRYKHKVAGVQVYPRQNQNNRAHTVTACISL
jgi:hypothetical protein